MADAMVTVESTLTIEGADALRLVSAHLVEALSEVPTLTCVVTAGAETPTTEAVIGKKAELELKRTDGGSERKFNGVVMGVRRLVSRDGNLLLELEIAPRLAKLAKRTDCTPYQKLDVKAIVSKVLEDAGITDMSWMLAGTYEKRNWTVQYRETDLAFVQRLLAEEGIWFTFQFDGKDTVVFSDDPKGFEDVPGTATLPFRQRFGHTELGDNVTKVRLHHEIRTDKVMLRDYAFERPKSIPEAKTEGKDDGAHVLEDYDYPGRFEKAPAGKQLAQVRLEQHQLGRRRLTGYTGALAVAPARRFTVEEHPVGKVNAEWMCSRVEVQITTEEGAAAGEEHRFSVSFTAFPTGDTPLRPPLRPAARVAPGLQTALTTGPAGEEIHVDKHGRVKTLFPWDRLGKKDETASDFWRTVQLPQGGAVYLPRVGWETSVDFLEGDVDRPVVFQRFYNAATPPPYALPANKARGSVQTATSPGGGSTNEFRTDDTKGKEEMFFNASKDMTVDVKNNTTESVKNNAKHQIGANHKLTVTNSVTDSVGADEKVTVSGNQDVHVQTFAVDDVGGAHKLSIGGNRDLKVSGDHKMEVAAGSTWTVSGNKIDLVVGHVSESTPASIKHDVGAALIEITASDRSVIVGGPRSETIGALKIIATNSARAVDVGATLNQTIGGAILAKISGDRNDNAEVAYNEVVGGAQIVKATNVTFEGQAMISLVMGASTITLLPAMVLVAGVSLKADAETVDNGIVVDN